MRTLSESNHPSALLIAPCRSVHTVGMRVPIDIAFLDREGRVLSTRRAVRPGVFWLSEHRAHAVLERVADEVSPWVIEGELIGLHGVDDRYGR